MKPDQLRVHSLLKDTLILLCKNGLQFHNDLRIQGTIGITVDDVDVFLVHINEVFGNLVDSAGDEEIMTSKSPLQRPIDPEVNTKSVKGQFRSTSNSSSMEQGTCIQRRTDNDTVDNAQPLDNPLSFAEQKVSVDDRLSYFNLSTNDTAASSNNSVALFDFVRAKIEPKYEENDDDVVLLSPEDVPLDSFGRGRYMDQTQTEADSSKWKQGKHQYDVRTRELLRKQYSNTRRAMIGPKDSPLNVREYEQNDFTGFSSQPALQQTMFQPTCSYTSENGELSSYLNNSYSTQLDDDMDSNDDTDDVGVDPMPVDNSQQSFFGDSNDDVSRGNQNFANSVVQHVLRKHLAADEQSQRKKKPGRPCQQIPRDCWDTVTATKFLCKMCGNSFNHRPSLLAHQINKHGRPKNRRGRPPAQPFVE